MLRKPTFSLAPIVAALCLLTLSACDRGNDSASTSSSGGASAASTQGAGGGGSGALRGKTVGFSQIGAESAWRTAETQSIESEAQKRGVNLKSVDAQGSQEKQIATLKSFVTQGVDAIILAPKTENGWDPVLREIKRANIPVILVDRGVSAPEELYTTLIASDFVAEGRMAGEWLAKKTNGKCNIAELQGTTGAAPANDRKKGFEQAISRYPDMKIIMSQTGDFNRSGGKQVMEAFLKSPQGKDIQAVYAHNDDMALGAIQAIEEAGKKPGQDVLVVSIDAVRGAFDAMVEGKLNCTVECNPLLGPAAFDAVEKTLAGQTLPKKTIVQDQIFTQEQAKDVIGTRKY